MQCHWICNCGIYMACIVLLFPCSRRLCNPLPNSICGKLRHQNVMEKQETNPSLLKPYPALETLPSTVTTQLLLVRDFFVSSASFQQICTTPGALCLAVFGPISPSRVSWWSFSGEPDPVSVDGWALQFHGYIFKIQGCSPRSGPSGL